MKPEAISRRDILRTLALGAAAGSVLEVIPAEAAAYVHNAIDAEKSAGNYTPKYFSAEQYATLTALCDAIIPKDDRSLGAVAAGAPEFVDLLSSENVEFQLRLGGGLMWLDTFCIDRYGNPYLAATREQQKQTLDAIAYRQNATSDPALSPGIAFFALLRRMTCDAYYTSKIGIADLQYVGNTALREFPGCPAIPD